MYRVFLFALFASVLSLEDLVRRMISLLDGVEGNYTCLCGRHLRVGLSPEIWEVRRRIVLLLEPATLEGEESQRFALLEVD